MIGLILICHGDLGESLVRTAESIVGPIEGTRIVSNRGKSPDVVERELNEAMASFEDPAGVLIMVDLFGSSCWRCGVTNAVESNRRDDVAVAIVSGVNLGTVLSFNQKRDTMPFRELAEAMATDAKRGINGPKFFPNGTP